jgi:hypothetical protein
MTRLTMPKPTHLTPMELVANVWPVADQQNGLVQRFFMRAYAMDADDATISRTLTALAPTDFIMAKVFPVQKAIQTMTDFGPLMGCVGIGDFHLLQSQVLDAAFQELEQDFAKLQGISMVTGTPVAIGTLPSFPPDPYLVVTTLVETPDGRLLPQLPNR